ncbi:4'-phosphopantetheinyl transferase family protein [Streptomyces sp. NPDC002659]|uniref:4'-phosphopantetheinyl transferase family protein n=1 Tax=Streptomyces sp. NPDC002659 TaxID=3364656 RepID=UPI0036ABCDC5
MVAESRVVPLAVVANTHEVLGLPGVDEGLLTEVERSRGAAFRSLQDRRDFVAAHLLVRMCAGCLLGVGPGLLEVVQHCAVCGREGHGRPAVAGLPGVHVSLSHTRDVVAAAAGWEPVGIDVERQGTSLVNPGVLRQVLTSSELRIVDRQDHPEAAFLRHWVRKEALVKMGRATLDTLYRLDLSALLGEEPTAAVRTARFGDLYLLEWTDERREAVAIVASTRPARLGVAPLPLSDIGA